MHPIRPRFRDQISHTNCGPPSEVRKVHDSPNNVRHMSPRSPVICVYFSRSTIYTKFRYVCTCMWGGGGGGITPTQVWPTHIHQFIKWTLHGVSRHNSYIYNTHISINRGYSVCNILLLPRSLDIISRQHLLCIISTPKGAFLAELPIVALQANSYTTYPSHPTGYPFIHLGGEQQCG